MRDFELKFSRSRHHLENLKARCDEYVAATEETLTHERHPQVPTQAVTYITGSAPPRDPFSLLVSDVLQCLRTGLDQLAFELATSFSIPLPDELAERSEFPIFGNADGNGAGRFKTLHSKGAKAGSPAPGSGLAKIEGMDPQAQSVIEGMQPYHAGSAYSSEPLWVIQELNRIDKHRLLHGTTLGQGFTAVSVPSVWSRAFQTPGFLPPGYVEGESGEIDGRTKVGSWPWPAGVPVPDDGADLGFHPVIKLTFEESVPLVGGQDIRDALIELYNHVVTNVVPPLLPFLK